MFGLGMQEILVIGVLALLLLGPKKLPELAQTVGKFVRDFQRAADEVKREITSPVNDMRDEMKRQAGLEPLDQAPALPRGPDPSTDAYGIAADAKATESEPGAPKEGSAGVSTDTASLDTTKPAG